MVEGSGNHIQRADAMSLMQDVLDTQSRALLDGDVATMRTTLNTPYRRITMDVDLIVENEADLHAGVSAFSNSLRSLGVNQLIRLATDAEFINDQMIEGHYVTHALRNATKMVPSYLNRIVLQNVDGVWRTIEVASEFESRGWPINLMHFASQGTVRNPKDMHDQRRNVNNPLRVYQQFLDRLTDATRERDFDAYIALCDLPYTYHGNALDTLMSTPEDVRPLFDMTVDMISGGKADTFERKAETAQFMGPNIMCGYHNSVFSKDGQEAIPAIKTRMILKHIGMGWKLKHVTDSIANDTYPYSAPEPTDALLTHREIQERTKSWPTSL